ncbi:MAG: hypothetical protein CMJ18_21600 [Phycisphaeraceae bacterium]|nr:hypothetical protein [Phycisphaeraceae bacterium]
MIGPAFETFEQVLLGRAESDRVHFVELGIDPEVGRYLVEHELRRPWLAWPCTARTRDDYWRQIVDLYAHLGYDYVPVWLPTVGMPEGERLAATDTADLSRGQRRWVNQHQGQIASRDDLNRYPWDEVTWEFDVLDVIAAHLPDGMRMVVSNSTFEVVLKDLLGYEAFFYLLHDDRGLVEETLERWGDKVEEYYREALRRPAVGAIFHADDLGFRTGSFLSPADTARIVLPWFRRYVSLAHENGRTAWLHSCGNLAALMDDLIDVGFDALHSFQDLVMPVTDFKRRYGHRIAALGGVDMDRFARSSEAGLRAYVRHVLGACVPGGRYALGSGNSVANYVPVRNYLAMLDEGRRWPDRLRAGC